MKRIFAVFLLSFGSAHAVVSPAAGEIAAGRADLAAHNFASAQTHFSAALGLDATNQTAGALLGITRVLSLASQTSTNTFLNNLAVPSPGRDVYHWTAQIPHDGSGNKILPSNYNLSTVEAFWRTTLLDATTGLPAARTSLALVTDTAFLLTLYPSETTFPAAVNIDYGDVLMARAGISAIEFIFRFLSGQNLDANLYAINQLAQGNMLTLRQVLADNANVLKVGSTSERTAALSALSNLISLYRQASTFIRTVRPAGVNRVFMLDQKDFPEESEFRASLDQIERSFTEPVATDEGRVAIYTAPLFGATWVLRDRFPTFNVSTGGFDLESITDPSLGGVAAGFTRERVADVFDNPELGWTWVSPTPQGNTLYRHLALANGKRIVAGDAGTVLTSDDGTTWTQRTVAPRIGRITGLAEGASKVVAVGFGQIFKSTDSGVTWQSVFEDFYTQFRSVTFGGGKFVAVGDGGLTAVSTDGVTWQVTFISGSVSLNDVIYTGTLYLATGFDGAQNKGVILTSSDGVTWINRLTAAGTGYIYFGVAKGSANYVVVGGNNHSAVSANATAWTESTVLSSGSTTFNAVAYNSGTAQFVTAGSGGTVATILDSAITTSAATNWTTLSSPESIFFNGVGLASDGIYLPGQGGVIERLTNLATTPVFARAVNPTSAAPVTTSFNSLRALSGNLYVVGPGGTILSSTDGLAFTSVTASGTSNALRSILQQGSTYYAVGDNGTLVTTTTPTGTWTAVAASTWTTPAGSASLRSISYLNGLFVVTGANAKLLTSPDGTNWTARTTLGGSPTGSQVLHGAAYGNGVYVAVGGDGLSNNYVFTSGDGGTTWIQRTLGITNTFRAVVFSQGYFTAVGTLGSVFRSADGVTWDYVDSGTSADIISLSVLDGRYYATAVTTGTSAGFTFGEEMQSAVLVSSDGQNWVRVPLGTGNAQNGVELFTVGGVQRLYTVGGSASILRSEPITLATLNTPVALAAAPATPVVQGTDHVLAVTTNASGGQTFAWSKGGSPIAGVSGPTLNLKNTQSSDAASYTVTVTNAAGGPSSTATFAYTVSETAAAPTITEQPESQILSVGSTATFSVSANGTNPLSYVWRKDGVPLSNGGNVAGATTGTLTLTNVQYTDAAAYTVVVSGIAPSVTSDQAILSIDSYPPFIFSTVSGGVGFSPSSRTVTTGGSTTFSVSATGPGTLTYQWRKNGVNISGATSASYTLSVVQASDAANYTVVVTSSSAGSAVSGNATLTVNPGPEIVSLTSRQTVPVGTTVSLSVGALGASTTTFQWEKDGVLLSDGGNISGATTSFLTLTNVSLSDSGQYAVHVTNTYAEEISDPIAVLVCDYTPYNFSTLAGRSNIGTEDGTGSAARFNQPYGIARDSAGNFYVADTSNHVIRKITPAGVVTTYAGSPGTSGSADGTLSVARFFGPRAIAIDSSDNIYVGDSANLTVRKITPGGVVSTMAGLAGRTGTADGNGTAARFGSPQALAVDSAGNVYVGDTFYRTIRKITSAGDVTTLAGLAGQFGTADGTGTAARFSSPSALAVDSSAGILYVADLSNHTIRAVTTSAGVVTTLAGSATNASAHLDGVGTAARFRNPSGLALNAAGNLLYVSDQNDASIRLITLTAGPTATVSTLAGAGATQAFGNLDGTGSAALFNSPRGLVLDATGTNLFTADLSNHNVRQITTAGGVVTTLAGSPPTAGSTNGAGSVARFFSPQDVAPDGSGNLYVADASNHTIRKIASDGTVTLFSGTAGTSGTTDGAVASAKFNGPSSVATDSAGTLVYIADKNNHTIRKYTAGTGNVSTFAGAANTSGSIDSPTGTSARFNFPSGVAVDSVGNVYVADSLNHTIRKITSAGAVTTLAGLPLVSGSDDGTGSNARFSSPSDVAVDSAGNVFVADRANSRVRKITPAGVVTTVLYAPGFVLGVGVDSANNVYATSNGVVFRVTPAGVITALAGKAYNSGSADGIGSVARFFNSAGVSVDSTGNVYLADAGSNTIRKGALPAAPTLSSVAPPTVSSGTVVTITGTGFTGATSVKFNGVNAAAFAVVNDTTITAIVPAGATTGPVTVTTGIGTSGTGVSLTITATASAQATELVTRVPASMEPQAASGRINNSRRMMSDDGRYVVFASNSPRVIAGQVDTNGGDDIFRWDRQTGVVILVSRATASALTTGNSSCEDSPSISASGQYIAYASFASNLVASDTNGQKDVFLFDAGSGTTTLVSRNSTNTGSAGDRSQVPLISADGRYVAYQSRATNLLTGQVDTNGNFDLFVYDRVGGTTALVNHTVGSFTTTTTEVPSSTNFEISANGGYLVYQSAANNLVTGQTDTNGTDDVFVYDTSNGTNALVSHTSAGASTAGGAGSRNAKISPDGTYIAFESDASDLLSTVTDGNSLTDVFLYKCSDGAVTLVTHTALSPTTTANNVSHTNNNIGAFSTNGNYLVYTSAAGDHVTDLNKPLSSGTTETYRYDRTANASILISRAAGSAATTPLGSTSIMRPTMSSDGRYVAFETIGDNIVAGFTGVNYSGIVSLYVFDATAGTAQLVNHTVGGASVQTTNGASLAQLSSDGAYLVFNSVTNDLLSGSFDLNSTTDVYQFDRGAGTNALVSRFAPGNGGLTAPGSLSFETAISGDGRYVAFSSNSRNLVPGLVAGGNLRQVFRWDRTTGSVILVSRAVGTTTTANDGYAETPWISNDGRFVAYEADNSTNLVAGQTAGATNLRAVFLFDAQLGTTTLVSHLASTQTGIGYSYSRGLGISGDGRYVFYYSNTDQAIAGQSNPGFKNNTYRWDRLTDTTLIVSHADGSPLSSGDGETAGPLAISSDGRFVAFPSSSTNLIAGQADSNGSYDVFLRDCQTDAITLVSRANGAATTAANGYSSFGIPGRMSDDGRFVAFSSNATNLLPVFSGSTGNIFLFDAVAGTNSLVTHGVGNVTVGLSQASDFGLSADGRYVVFKSSSSNLVADQDDTNGTTDLFVYDRQTTSNTLISRAAGTTATAANFGIGGYSGFRFPMTRNGRYVAFSTVSTNLVAGVTPSPTNDWDVYVADLQTGVIVLASRQIGGGLVEAGGDDAVRLMAADAPIVLFGGTATTLIAGNYFSGGEEQLYVYEADLLPPTVAISAPTAITTTGASVSYTLTYTDATTIGLLSSQVLLNTTGNAGATVTVTGSGPTARTVTLSAFTGSGTIGISLPPGTAADASSNPALGAGPSATISVATLPATIGTQPAQFAAGSIGNSATLTVSATSPNSGTLTYQWRKFGQPIVGNGTATTNALVLTNLSAYDAGLYDVVVFNNGSPLVSATATRLVVNQSAGVPPQVLTASSGFAPLFEYDSGVVDWIQRANDGKFYLSGPDFTSIGGMPRPGLGRLNVDGSFDAAFVPPSTDDTVWAFGAQSTGKVIIGGDFETVGGYPRLSLARLNSTGSLDLSFVPAVKFTNGVYAIVIQPDDKIIVGGGNTYGYGPNIVRLNIDGSLDSTFTPGTGFGGDIRAMVRQGDGKIVVGGTFGSFNSALVGRIARLNTDGTLDTTFNNGGGGFNSNVRALALQANGDIIAGGNFSSYNGTSRIYAARLNGTTGALDTGFVPPSASSTNVYGVNWIELQSDGMVIIAGSNDGSGAIARLTTTGSLDLSFGIGSGFNSSVNGVALLPSGQILAAPSYNGARFNNVTIGALARINSNGTLDSAYEPGIREPGYVYAFALAPGGKMIVGGDFLFAGGFSSTRLARINPDGSFDPTFNVGTGFNNTVNTVVVQPDGHILVGGFFNNYNGVTVGRFVRLNSDGTRDTTFNLGTGFNSTVNAIALQSDGRVLIGGAFTSYNGTAVGRIARLNADGSLDVPFSTPTSGFNNAVNTLTVMTDGDIYVGGSFTSYRGATLGRIARLNADGSLDSGFVTNSDPSFPSVYGFNSTVQTISLQLHNGVPKIVVGGGFTSYNGTTCGYLTRLMTDGSRDAGFAATQFNNTVLTALVQSDGHIIAGGYFYRWGNYPDQIDVPDLARVNADGTFDATFKVPGFNFDEWNVYALGASPNGGVLIAGSFLSFPSVNRAGLAELVGAPGPNITTSPGNQVASAGGTVTFTVAATGLDLFYQWRRDGIAVPGATGPTLTLNNVQLVDAGSYTVTISNLFGTSTSSPATLSGPGAAPTITVGPASVSVLTGTNATLSVTASGATNYQWRKLSQPIAGATGSTFTITGATLGDAGLYDVIVGNGLTVISSSTARVAVQPATSIQNPLFTSNSFPAVVEYSSSSPSLYKMLVEPGGKYYVVGGFSSVDGKPRRGLVRFNADGSIDLGFNPDSVHSGGITVIARQPSDGKIVIGGEFSGVGTAPFNSIARLNLDGTVDSTFNPGTGFNSDVTAIAIQSDGKIVVGGSFTKFNEASCSPRIARLTTTGQLDTTFDTNAGSGFSHQVRALAVHTDGTIYVGGNFTAFNGQSVSGFTRLSANGTHSPLSQTTSGFNGTIFTLMVLSDGRVIAGGTFTTYNGSAANYIAGLSADGSLDPGFVTGTGFDSWVLGLARQSDGGIVAAGYFTNYNSVAAGHIVRLTSGGARDGTFAIGTGVMGSTNDVGVLPDGDVVVVGDFSELVAGSQRTRLVRYDSNGSLDAAHVDRWGQAGGDVTAILPAPGGKWLIAGQIESVAGVAVKNIIRLNADATVDSTYYTAGGAPVANIFTLAMQGDGKIFVGGQFSTFYDYASPVDAHGIVRLNTDGTLDHTFATAGGPDYAVRAIAVQRDGRVVVGGDFTTFNGVTRRGLVRLMADGALDPTFNVGGSGVNGGSEGPIIYAIVAQPDGKILVGGDFSTYNGQTANRLMRLNSDGTLDTGFQIGTGFDGVVRVVTVQPDGKILVGGSFSQVNSLGAKGLARLNSDGSVESSATFNPGLGFTYDSSGLSVGSVASLSIQGDNKIVVAGSFYYVDGASHNHLVRLNPNGAIDATFGNIVSPNVGSIEAAAVRPDGKVLIGGGYLAAGVTDRYGLVLIEGTSTAPLPTTASSPAASQFAAAGSNLTLAVTSTSTPTPTYQWYFNGNPINLATSASYTINGLTSANSGNYTVALTNAGGTFTAGPFHLDVVTRDMQAASMRFVVPVRGSVAGSFTIEGSATKSVLIRGVGPAFSGVGLQPSLTDPQLKLFDGVGTQIAVNDNWVVTDTALTTASAAVGATPVFAPGGSNDAAILITLNPGTYTAVLDGVGGLGGTALLQFYDNSAASNLSRIVMFTARGTTGPGSSVAVPGISLVGGTSKQFLIRAFGVSLNNNRLNDPVLELFNSSAVSVASNDNWETNTSATSTDITNATVAAGLPPLGRSFDSALLLNVAPGTYTTQVTGAGGTSGDFGMEIALLDANRPITIPPAILFLSRNQSAVNNGSVSFGVHVMANPAPAYLWRKNGTIVPGATTPVLTLSSITPSDDGSTVTVEITSGANTITSAPRSIFVLPDYHTADTNHDGAVDLKELTRVIQLYNYPYFSTDAVTEVLRTGEYHTQAGTEDGFAPGPGGSITTYHLADTNKDGKISVTELSRVIELFSYKNGTVQTGQYHAATGTEDGFTLGPIPPPPAQ